jgi:hypothetical protein
MSAGIRQKGRARKVEPSHPRFQRHSATLSAFVSTTVAA